MERRLLSFLSLVTLPPMGTYSARRLPGLPPRARSAELKGRPGTEMDQTARLMRHRRAAGNARYFSAVARLRNLSSHANTFAMTQARILSIWWWAR